MSAASLAQLMLLGAIWGGAHALTRYSVPAFEPAVLVELRIGMAAVLLALVAWATSRPLRLRQQWRQIVVLGAVNTAVPFFLQAYAAKTLNASVLSVLNATAPVFGAVVGALWLREALSLRAGLGLALGIGGVAVIVSADLLHSAMPTALPVLAALGTSLAYAVASNYARRHARTLDHFNSAHGSLWVALLMILPAMPGSVPPGPIEAGHAAAAVALGIVCTGVAYLLYFKLIRDVGPTSALTVAYLIPVFGVLWGVVLLGEPLTPTLLAGGAMVIAGTALITGFGLARLGLAASRGRE